MNGSALHPPARLGRSYRAAWWAIAGASLWMRSGFPVFAIGNAGLDDALFVRLARNLGAGLWLGSFDNTTLVKGMFYPLFILLSFAAGIPLKLAEQGVYLAASAGVALLVARALGRRWAGTVLFVALAFNPVLWTVSLSRVIREGLYVGLSLAVMAVAAGFLLPGRYGGRAGLVRGLALGGLAGAFWLTREEGVWLLPALAVVLLAGVVGAVRTQGRTQGARAAAAPLALAALGFAATTGAVMAMNKHVYGRAVTVEVKSAAFEGAYGALSRIAQQDWRRYVVFPKDARALAYRVSPAARELQPYFEGKDAAGWVAVGCEASPMADCTEIQASWFQWALRDAVKGAGHYASLPEAARFYDQLAHEINAACDRQEIPCLPPRTGLMPPFRWHYATDALRAASNLAWLLLHPGPEEIRPVRSEGPNVAIDLFAETAGPVGRGTTDWFIMEGWIGARQGPPLLAVRPPPGTAVRTEVLLADGAAPPSAPGFPMQRLRLVTDCPVETCDLLLTLGDRTEALGKLASIVAGTRIEQPDMLLEVTGRAIHIGLQGQTRRSALIERIAHRIAWAYGAVLPVLAATGALGLILAVLTGGVAGLTRPLVVLAMASAVAVACRIALLAYVDVTSIASQNLLYASPAQPFVIVFAVAGTLMLAELGQGAVRRRRIGRRR